MPNWCYTSYALTGPRRSLKSLHDKMNRLQSRSEPLLPNGFGVSWLGCLVKRLGGDPVQVYCRGDWNDLRFDEDTGVLWFNTMSAWGRPDEVEALIQSVYPDIEILFLEDEPGMDVFRTNDAEGRFFAYRFELIDGDESEYKTKRELLDSITAKAGRPCTSRRPAPSSTPGTKPIRTTRKTASWPSVR